MKKILKTFFGLQKEEPANEYTRIDVGDNLDDDFKALLKKNKELLTLNGVSLNKIRFVYTPAFRYDIDNNIINPKFVALIPSNKNAPIIEIDKPKNVTVISVRSYGVEDNYGFIKMMAKKSKRGLAIYICDHKDAIDSEGNKFSYEFNVDADELRLRNLDEIIIPEEINEEDL